MWKYFLFKKFIMDEDVYLSSHPTDSFEPAHKRLKLESDDPSSQRVSNFNSHLNNDLLSASEIMLKKKDRVQSFQQLENHLEKVNRLEATILPDIKGTFRNEQLQNTHDNKSKGRCSDVLPVVQVPDLKEMIKNSLLPVIPCFMVMETLQSYAEKQGYRFQVITTKKRKHSSPYAETEWFYNSHSCVKPGKYSCRRSPLTLTGCKALLVKAHQLKANKIQTSRRSHNMFEVEYIANFKVIQDRRYYLVKWVGWPSEANTWEPVTNLSCSGLIRDFHEDYMRKLLTFFQKRELSWFKIIRPVVSRKHVLQRLFDMIPNNFHFVSDYALKKQQLFLSLKIWQKKINSKRRGLPIIAVENEVDLAPLPDEFTWVVSNIPGKGVLLPTDPLIGCECVTGCSIGLEKGKCCPGFHKGKIPYQDGLIRLRPGRPIFECNSRCKCGPECPNRVVQKGSQIAISLFRTANGKGWGVKALQPIVKGSFVMEYVGEIITNDEAERRGKEYDSNGITYLFDLDFCDSENPLTVDATNFGNISHFVNHSCSPNLQVYNVFIDNLDPSLPRIALFARKNIAINEELTFDYQMTGDMTDGRCVLLDDVPSSLTCTPPSTNGDDCGSEMSYSSSCSSIKKRTRCLCGSTNCRKWLI